MKTNKHTLVKVSWYGRLAILSLILGLSTLSALAQSRVQGRVTDSNTGEPLPGVNVLVKGTTMGTATDPDGKYDLSVPSLQDTLVISYIGYQSQTIPINGRTTIDVALNSQVISGGQLVVIGYGTQKKENLTGAISTVSDVELAKLPVHSVTQALQGRVAGVHVTNNGGPGTTPIIHIRGISSISYATNPLFVVDGMPTTNIGGLDSRDVASVEVLKDASSAAIYGSRATNGVIIITTKKGTKNTGMHINYDSYVGVQSAWKKLDLLNTQQYLKYERALNGAADIVKPARLESDNFNEPIYSGAAQTYAQTNTDWQDAYFRSGLLTDQHLSLSGGNEDTRFYASGGYYKNNGITVGQNYQRGNFRLNSEHDISKIFSFGENAYLAYSKQRYDATGGNRTRLVQVIRSLPYLPVYDPTTDGGFRAANNSIDGADPTNPVENALLSQAHNNTSMLFGTAWINVNITPWLSFKSTFGINHSNLFQHQWNPIFNDKGNSLPVAGIINMRNNTTSLLFTQQLTFDHTFGKHHFNVVAVYEQQGTNNFTENSSGNQATNDLQTLTGATNIAFNSAKSKIHLVSYVGRLNYDYADKYLLSLAIRRDGLSIWAPDHKWANFPSGSIGWRIDRETFMQDQNLISELKIRAGYGVTGLNGQIIANSLSAYPWQVRLHVNNATYPFNNTLNLGNASYYDALGNPNLAWEKTKQLDVGLDIGFLANKVTLSADYYKRKTDNLLLAVPTPMSFGLFQSGQAPAGVLANVGKMENHGVDVQLGYHKLNGDFTWNITGLVSVVRNEVQALGTPNGSIGAGGDQDFGGGGNMTLTKAGHPIQSFYGYVVQGIFQSQAEVDKAAYQTDDTAPGDIRFKDLNKDGVINTDDETFIGSYLPDFSYSLNYNARYKNFDLSLFIQGVYGNKIFDAENIIRQGMVRLFGAGTAVLDAWTPSNTDTDVPRAIAGDPNHNARPSTRWIEDGSYLRLKNVQIGYNIPTSTLASLTNGAVSSFRVYVASQNLLTFTGYSGWDPEVGSKNTTLTGGIDYGQYPAARSFMIGVQLGI